MIIAVQHEAISGKFQVGRHGLYAGFEFEEFLLANRIVGKACNPSLSICGKTKTEADVLVGHTDTAFQNTFVSAQDVSPDLIDPANRNCLLRKQDSISAVSQP